MRCFCVVVLAIAALPACERRVAEPASKSAEVPTSDGPKSKASTPPTPAATVARCLRPTPPQPARPAPPKGPDPNCPEDPEQRPELERARVVFEQAKSVVEVEVAKQDAHRMRGLMYRKELPEDEGMLFVFERPRVQRFWMKNTCLPLDMLFIARDGLIVGIEENVPTMNTRSYHVGCPSLYVLEVNAGWSRAHGVEAGQRVRLEGV